MSTHTLMLYVSSLIHYLDVVRVTLSYTDMHEIVHERVTHTTSHVCMSTHTLTHTLAYLCTVPIAAETDGLPRFRAVCRATSQSGWQRGLASSIFSSIVSSIVVTKPLSSIEGTNPPYQTSAEPRESCMPCF